jgi:hypothetical protein
MMPFYLRHSIADDYEGCLEMFLDGVRALFIGDVISSEDWVNLYDLCFGLCTHHADDDDKSRGYARIMDGIIEAFDPVLARFQDLKLRHRDVMDYLKSTQIVRGQGGREVQGLILVQVQNSHRHELMEFRSDIGVVVKTVNRICSYLNRFFSRVDTTLLAHLEESILEESNDLAEFKIDD